jgi:PadR family transcriptional regulator PadR
MYNYGEFIRGFTEYIVLSILSVQDSYGYEIRKTILTVSENEFDLTEATLYLTLKRLLEANMIGVYERVNDKGVKRVYYWITSLGTSHLLKFREDVSGILGKIETLVKGEKNER